MGGGGGRRGTLGGEGSDGGRTSSHTNHPSVQITGIPSSRSTFSDSVGSMNAYSGTPVYSDYWSAGAFGKSVDHASLTEGSSPTVLRAHLFQYERDQLSHSMSVEFEQQRHVKFVCARESLSSLHDVMQAPNVQSVPGKRIEACQFVP